MDNIRTTNSGPPGGTHIESITGSDFGDTLTGSCANNTLAPVSGNDTVNGDPDPPGTDNDCAVFGNDFMGGGNGQAGGVSAAAAGTFNGNDVFNGLGGFDSVTYTHNTSSQGITVDIDGAAGDADGFDDNDGIGGEDNVNTDIERVFGGAGNDTINADFTGVAGVSLFGRDGDDILTGSDSNDTLDGEVGADTLDCQGNSSAAGDKFRHDGFGPAPVNCEDDLDAP
jgi:Ca2+-binding RTX toxin-like protein